MNQHFLERPAFTASVREEILAVLYLIAALLARQNGLTFLSVILFAAFVVDTILAVVFALVERSERKKEVTA